MTHLTYTRAAYGRRLVVRTENAFASIRTFLDLRNFLYVYLTHNQIVLELGIQKYIERSHS